MDNIIDQIGNYFASLGQELGEMGSQIEGEGWVAISAVLLVCGWFWLRGNKVKA